MLSSHCEWYIKWGGVNWNKTGISEKRFNGALEEFSNTGYKIHIGTDYDLYKMLRCGLIHSNVPGSHVELIQEGECPKFGNHLEIVDIRGEKRLLLVSKHFLKDFEEACMKIQKKIERREIRCGKVYKEFVQTEL